MVVLSLFLAGAASRLPSLINSCHASFQRSLNQAADLWGKIFWNLVEGHDLTSPLGVDIEIISPRQTDVVIYEDLCAVGDTRMTPTQKGLENSSGALDEERSLSPRSREVR